MKYLRTYEELNNEIKVGDIVYCIDINDCEDVLKEDTKYEIIKIFEVIEGDRVTMFCNVRDVETGQKKGRSTMIYDSDFGFFLDRFISEMEYTAKKYNL